MVRVLAVADEVADSIYDARVKSLNPDLVVAAGDLPWDYLEFLVSVLDVPAVFVPGNHDPELSSAHQSRMGVFTSAGMVADAPRPQGVTNIDGRAITVAGLRVAGLGGCVEYNGGPHQYTQAQFRRRARSLIRAERRQRQSKLDILLTHAPPRHLGDGQDSAHHGFEALRAVMWQLQPTWHLHGHIHPYGFPKPDRKFGATAIRNVIPYVMMEVTPRSTVAESSVESVAY